MNRPFKVILSAYKEESSGQVAELIRFAEKAGADYLSSAELSGLNFSEMITSSDGCTVPRNSLLYIDKKNNANLITAIRAALTFDADGVIIKFGNNPMRDYIINGQCFTAQEVKAALGELKRLAPLFARRS